MSSSPLEPLLPVGGGVFAARRWAECHAGLPCRDIKQLEFDKPIPASPATIPDERTVVNLPVVIMIEQPAAIYWPFNLLEMFKVKRLLLHELL